MSKQLVKVFSKLITINELLTRSTCLVIVVSVERAMQLRLPTLDTYTQSYDPMSYTNKCGFLPFYNVHSDVGPIHMS